MLYFGSKSKLAKYIIPILEPYLEKADYYIEPFVGGCNLIDKINHKNKTGYDIDQELIDMWIELLNGWIPPKSFTKEFYYNVLNNQSQIWPSHVRGYILGCAHGGRKGHGFSNSRNGRDYTNEYYRNIMKQLPLLKGIKLEHKCYKDIQIPKNSLIYCDPPYRNSQKYKNQDIDYEEFDKWCLDLAKEHIVFVSEKLGALPYTETWSFKRTCTARESKLKGQVFIEALYKVPRGT